MTVHEETMSFIEGFAEKLSETAEWRRRKAAQHPDDTRNLTAAKLLDELAGEIGTLQGGELDQNLASLWTQEPGDELGCLDEQSELLREVGFHWFGDATDLAKTLVSRFKSRL